jgi:hypothetical protein
MYIGEENRVIATIHSFIHTLENIHVLEMVTRIFYGNEVITLGGG